MSEIDFGRHSDDYAVHGPGLPASFYRRLDAIAPIRGSRSLDLATGPGKIALELAARGATVVGIDISGDQIGMARRVARERNLEERVDFEVASAEETGLDESSFDLVTAGQCWHWFDGEAALEESRRVLRPGGVLAIVGSAHQGVRIAGTAPPEPYEGAMTCEVMPSRRESPGRPPGPCSRPWASPTPTSSVRWWGSPTPGPS